MPCLIGTVHAVVFRISRNYIYTGNDYDALPTCLARSYIHACLNYPFVLLLGLTKHAPVHHIKRDHLTLEKDSVDQE